ncbi:MAG TPA: cell division protein FtsZ [bacterium]|nr:cell division protein FtsZ [bacterium]
MLEFADQKNQVARIRVVGVGGAGGNAVNRMIEDGLTGVDFININTDLQALDQNKAPCRLQIGKNLTKGLGAGGDPDVGRKAIEENKDAVIESLSDSDMIFIAAGMGGGTGTGAAPVVAEIARDLGALTVGVVTTPFIFEGVKRAAKAEQGIRALKEYVDTLIIVPNQRLISLVDKNTPLEMAFRIADEILLHATRGISDLINIPGLINLDFADVRTIMSQMGDALMGSGLASGEDRAQEAAKNALSSPMIDDVSIMGAQGVLVNITGGKDLSLNDINEATTIIYEAAGSEANVIFGAVIDGSMNAEIRVTVIATGFKHTKSCVGSQSVCRTEKTVQTNAYNEPLFEKWDHELLEQVMGETAGHDGSYAFISRDDLNIPAFIRRQKE